MCPRDFAHTYSHTTLACNICYPQHLSTLICNTLQIIVSVVSAVAAVDASEMLCSLLGFVWPFHYVSFISGPASSED